MKIASISLIAATGLAATNAFAPNPSTFNIANRGIVASELTVLSATEAEAEANKEESKACGCDEERKPGLPALLEPFVEALDPKYKSTGTIGEGVFIVSRTGGPTKEELSNENLYKILMIECNDLEVNTVVWKCLGYRFDETAQEWTAAEVFPNWKERFPAPPDMIGMARIYSKEVDQPSLRANQSIVRSVPVDNKQSLKTHLRPLGFTGYKVCDDLLVVSYTRNPFILFFPTHPSKVRRAYTQQDKKGSMRKLVTILQGRTIRIHC